MFVMEHFWSVTLIVLNLVTVFLKGESAWAKCLFVPVK